eukprot:228753_1
MPYFREPLESRDLTKVKLRTVNFSIGPSAIDLTALREAQQHLTNYNGTGMGIFEMSHHNSSEVQTLIANVSFRISKLLNVPQNYQIFFMHGGAHSQFAAIPLNICGFNHQSSIGGYVNTGYWSEKARNEANKFIKAIDICQTNGKSIPDINEWKVPQNCAYIHICANESISGIELLNDPDLPPNAPPLIADFSSTLFSRPIDIEKYGMIYASGGNNFGPSGVCICIVRDDLIEKSKINNDSIPGILSWNEFSNSLPIHSIYNTPSIFQIYMTDLILQKVYGERFNNDMNKVQKWVKQRANTIYTIFDEYPTLFKNDIDKEYRSVMNIPFRIYDHVDERIDSVLEYKFLKQAEEEWYLNQLEGDNSVGGMRVNLFTGIPDDSIKLCAKFMRYFADYHAGND